MNSSEKYSRARDEMVTFQLAARGIHDPGVISAMKSVPREEFVRPDLVESSYEDTPLPIGEDQTISQPYIVALMAEILELDPADRVLEIGTGSGYAAAVLSRIAEDVYTIERLPLLAESAEVRCRGLGYDNVHVKCGDGTLGWPEQAPFNGILVSAASPAVPEKLKHQLAIDGRLIIPIGPRTSQTLIRVTRTQKDKFIEEDLGAVRFVPLIGKHAWPDSDLAV